MTYGLTPHATSHHESLSAMTNFEKNQIRKKRTKPTFVEIRGDLAPSEAPLKHATFLPSISSLEWPENATGNDEFGYIRSIYALGTKIKSFKIFRGQKAIFPKFKDQIVNFKKFKG